MSALCQTDIVPVASMVARAVLAVSAKSMSRNGCRPNKSQGLGYGFSAKTVMVGFAPPISGVIRL